MDLPYSLLHAPGTVPPRRTLVVLGLHRGGTSMLAGVARLLGVFLGDDLHTSAGGDGKARTNHEDLEFQGLPPAKIVEAIGRRNARHDVWGWKDPATLLTIHEWYRRLRHPFFLVGLRDVLAVSQTEVKVGAFPGLLEALRAKQAHTGKILDFVEIAAREGLPTMLVSYERALRAPEALVEGIARFFGLPLDAATLRRAAAYVDPARGYAPIEAPTAGTAEQGSAEASAKVSSGGEGLRR